LKSPRPPFPGILKSCGWKAHSADGKYVYSTGKHPKEESFGRTAGIVSEAILKVQYAMNTVCIKCFSGMANAACAAIDSMDWDGVVGTIAGDDTIFVLCRSEREAQIFTVNLEKMLHA
jgi:transcriptional regulator of arginine metabolism